MAGPEAKIQADIMAMFRRRGWFVVNIHGNAFQFGLPDLFCSHKVYGQKWIEVKYRTTFTKAQKDKFPKMAAAGVKIWVMTEASEEQYHRVITLPPNWHLFMRG